MTDDKELIARLREIQGQAGLFASAAAARIEALTAERDDFADQISELLPSVNREAVEQRQRADAAEAKLAQAEAGLREIAGECGCFIARTTLAEIKGESHD